MYTMQHITFEVVNKLYLLVPAYWWHFSKYQRHSSIGFQVYFCVSTGERPILDILQDRRYWVIHLITIPSLFLGGVILVLSGFVYKLFGVANNGGYLNNSNTQISLINDRFFK
jgi:photosystem II cytochrome b559 subunit alpha